MTHSARTLALGTGEAIVSSDVVYKICSAAEWTGAVRAGHWSGSADDRRDGYVHLSTRAQLAATAARHFRNREDLVVVAFDTVRLASDLRWEPSRGGALFPHLYGPLPAAAGRVVGALSPGPDGVPVIPEDLAC
jgi:uncharacterized protein (DUF952 family)